MRRIYLDYAASTPLDQRVLKVMLTYLKEEFGNPGSLHSFGQKAIAAVDATREVLAKALEVNFREIIFTGSATEANNLFLNGAVIAFRKKYPDKKPRLIISAIEHESILETAKALQDYGVEVIILPVNKKGIVSLEALEEALTENTVAVSVMYVNNETGAIQPLSKMAKMIKECRAADGYPIFHTDASQAFQFFACLPRELGVDAMTLSGHKIYGPKGIGALYLSSKVQVEPGLRGGGQEFGLRSSTENVPVIAGFGKAASLALAERESRSKYVRNCREKFLNGLKRIFPKLQVNGDGSPHILNVWLPDYPAEDLLMRLDLMGIAVSSGSACRSRSFERSYVLEAMGFPKKRVRESIRVSFGANSKEDIDGALEAFKKIARG